MKKVNLYAFAGVVDVDPEKSYSSQIDDLSRQYEDTIRNLTKYYTRPDAYMDEDAVGGEIHRAIFGDSVGILPEDGNTRNQKCREYVNTHAVLVLQVTLPKKVLKEYRVDKESLIQMIKSNKTAILLKEPLPDRYDIKRKTQLASIQSLLYSIDIRIFGQTEPIEELFND